MGYFRQFRKPLTLAFTLLLLVSVIPSQKAAAYTDIYFRGYIHCGFDAWMSEGYSTVRAAAWSNCQSSVLSTAVYTVLWRDDNPVKSQGQGCGWATWCDAMTAPYTKQSGWHYYCSGSDVVYDNDWVGGYMYDEECKWMWQTCDWCTASAAPDSADGNLPNKPDDELVNDGKHRLPGNTANTPPGDPNRTPPSDVDGNAAGQSTR